VTFSFLCDANIDLYWLSYIIYLLLYFLDFPDFWENFFELHLVELPKERNQMVSGFDPLKKAPK